MLIVHRFRAQGVLIAIALLALCGIASARPLRSKAHAPRAIVEMTHADSGGSSALCDVPDCASVTAAGAMSYPLSR